MKPVDKAETVLGLNAHGDAKPQLLARLGEFCSYCECSGAAQQLHVEHIYPQTDTAHPGLSKNWRNFLIACSTCNTYKAKHLGNGKQTRMLKRFVWPHIDNTIRCFDYFADGRVEVVANLHPDVQAVVESTRDMVGLMISPGATADYAGTGIAYDGIQKRSAAWGIAQRARAAYEENPSQNQLASLLDNATQTGHFSVWMQVFHDRPAVRRDVIRVFKAAGTCFNANTDPVPRGRV